MSKYTPCDSGDCPFNATGGMQCRDYCGLGVDEDEDVEKSLREMSQEEWETEIAVNSFVPVTEEEWNDILAHRDRLDDLMADTPLPWEV